MTHSFDRKYWDQLWTGERGQRMDSGEPNPHLVREIGGLRPGTALDAGCGAGAEAIWLAANGWDVTGADVADAALDYAADRAAAAGVVGDVRWIRADLSVWEPETRYDLVTTHYAHPAIPQLEFYDRLASWVAPGGTLLIVGHLHQHSSAGDTHPPSEVTATAAAITSRFDPSDWEIVTAEESHRSVIGPGGRSNRIDDVVVRLTSRRSAPRVRPGRA
ncbi:MULTISPECIES: class I SAM-dependent methyltransferase [unclassified Brevibacterium]|uniref:class I SAM-dependent methyltransferase n=1 Tax=unclassified Brevibacterium TaxID=2614124 RepID=UPI001092BDD0|nr:methyltransferase domain-containing protein [Brevibacterium sp. S22]TGD27791.1 methyltransferase domain-containing protein [Brevibacterium sp. S22]